MSDKRYGGVTSDEMKVTQIIYIQTNNSRVEIHIMKSKRAR